MVWRWKIACCKSFETHGGAALQLDGLGLKKLYF